MPLTVVIPVLKCLSYITQKFNLGSGSTWPGHIALKIDPKFVEHIAAKSRTKMILVIGTNGKTTTAAVVAHILRKQGKTVFQNREGANLLSGIASTFVKNATSSGVLEYDFAVLEVDENNVSSVLSHVHPEAILALDLFRDQLDRYGEVNTVAQKWHTALEKLKKSTRLILNSDDPQIRYLGHATHHKATFFAVESKYYEKVERHHDMDSVFCPVCREPLTFLQIAFSHLGRYKCKKCGYENAKIQEILVKYYPLEGVYNFYNINGAILTSSVVLGVPPKVLISDIDDFLPAFGRGETIKYHGREFVILLAKNPAGYNQVIQRVVRDKNSSHVLLILNDRVPDGHDISWIWDVNFEDLLARDLHLHLSGDRVWDLAARIQYSSPVKSSKLRVESYNSKPKTYESVSEAIREVVKNTKQGERIYILPTYSAMVDIRKYLTGKKFV